MKSRVILMLSATVGLGWIAGSNGSLLTPAATAAPTLPADYNPSLSLAPLVKALSPAVVNIHVATRSTNSFSQGGVELGQGSGFLISEDGYLLTNNHVIDNAAEVVVTLADEREFSARVIGTDESTDVALVKIDTTGPLPFVELGSSGDLDVGDWVVAIGNPFGLSHTVTAGIVSAKGRVIGAGPYDDFIQTDASINPGNSGGPLFDLQGEVVGINTAINAQAQGIGFAVPVDMVTAIVDDLRENGHVARGWLGIGLDDLDNGGGVVVRSVYDNTPAADAGIQIGDQLLSIDGQSITDSPALVRAIGERRAGDMLDVVVSREGRRRRVSITLGERPSQEDLLANRFVPSEPAQADPPRLGIVLEERNIPGQKNREIVVNSVIENSPADGTLHVGDILRAINDEPIDSMNDIHQALARSSSWVTLSIMRDNTAMDVRIKVS